MDAAWLTVHRDKFIRHFQSFNDTKKLSIPSCLLDLSTLYSLSTSLPTIRFQAVSVLSRYFFILGHPNFVKIDPSSLICFPFLSYGTFWKFENTIVFRTIFSTYGNIIFSCVCSFSVLKSAAHSAYFTVEWVRKMGKSVPKRFHSSRLEFLEFRKMENTSVFLVPFSIYFNTISSCHCPFLGVLCRFT